MDGGASVSVVKLTDELTANDEVVTGDEFNECEFIVILMPVQFGGKSIRINSRGHAKSV